MPRRNVVHSILLGLSLRGPVGVLARANDSKGGGLIGKSRLITVALRQKSLSGGTIVMTRSADFVRRYWVFGSCLGKASILCDEHSMGQ